MLAFEDLHWADPTSLDLMRALAERGAQAPLLIIATARPEFRPPWSVRSHHSVISLSPLDSAQIAKMVRELSARHALPKDIVEGVSERTGGVPLFVEEVTRLLLERGEQGGAQAIPPTLQQSLAARLDRLGSARETAQIGAVLGRGFSYALLQSVAGLDEGALQSSLERLAEADILFVEGDGAQATYRFKHALIQDAAYDSLLKSRRQALHAQAAEILRESASPEPEAIAHHFTASRPRRSGDRMVGQGRRPGAAPLGLPGGDRPSRQGDRHGGQGGRDGAPCDRRLGRSEPATDAVARRPRQRADCGARLSARRRRPKRSQRRANSAAGGKDAPERLAAEYGLWAGSFVRGELPSMRAHVGGFPRRRRGETRFAGGRRRSSRRWDNVLVRRRISRGAGSSWSARSHCSSPAATMIWLFALDRTPASLAMHYLALTLWPMGDIGRAVSLVGRAEARIADLTHVGTLAHWKNARGHV